MKRRLAGLGLLFFVGFIAVVIKAADEIDKSLT